MICMILLFVAATSIIQFCLYLVSDRLRYANGKYIISIFFIIGHLVIFPAFFVSTEMRDFKCGMAEVGIYGAFWVFGLGATLLVWVLYTFVFRKFFLTIPKATKNT